MGGLWGHHSQGELDEHLKHLAPGDAEIVPHRYAPPFALKPAIRLIPSYQHI